MYLFFRRKYHSTHKSLFPVTLRVIYPIALKKKKKKKEAQLLCTEF